MSDTYVSKPVEIEAKRWCEKGCTGLHHASPLSVACAHEIVAWVNDNGGEAWCGCACGMDGVHTGAKLVITVVTLEGTMAASPGDWIIQGTEGEFYPCKPSVFERKYERKS